MQVFEIKIGLWSGLQEYNYTKEMNLFHFCLLSEKKTKQNPTIPFFPLDPKNVIKHLSNIALYCFLLLSVHLLPFP